jgi:hypothetical protein
MDKNTKNQDDVFEAPADEVQAKITELMGLPIDRAEPTLSKEDSPNVVKNEKPKSIAKKPTAVAKEDNQLSNNELMQNDVSDIQSPQTDKAVIEILQNESDELLDKQDNRTINYKVEPKKPKNIKYYVNLWWQNKLVRNFSLFLVIAAGLVLVSVPSSRYAVLNTAGVRASTSFTVVDQISGRPVKNVDVTLADKTAKTAEDGTVYLSGLKLGNASLTLSKRSFEPVNTNITIGWGSNPLDAPFEVLPTGTNFEFKISDWLDEMPIKDAEISDGESTAVTNAEGVANLKIEPTDEDIIIYINANGYKTNQVTIPATSTAPQNVKLTAYRPDIFVSNRSGQYDIYTRDIDGANEELILRATGSEQPDTHLLGNNQTYEIAALVSAREGERNQEGYILSNLYVLDVGRKIATKVDATQSERIMLVGWHQETIIFVKTIAGPSATFGSRQRVIAYDYKKQQQKELASANYFSDVRLINDKVYYVVASGIGGSQGLGLGVIGVDGNDRRALVAENIWAVYRSRPQELVINSDKNWYKYDLNTTNLILLTGQPANNQDLKLFESPKQDKFVKVEKRDGQTELILIDKNKDEESVILRQPGISSPITWVNNKTVMYSVITDTETARYVVSLTNNKAVKIGDIASSVYDGMLFY